MIVSVLLYCRRRSGVECRRIQRVESVAELLVPQGLVGRSVGCQRLQRETAQIIVSVDHPLLFRPHVSVLRHHESVTPIVDQIFRFAAGHLFFDLATVFVVMVEVAVVACQVARGGIARSLCQTVDAFGRYYPRKPSAVIVNIPRDDAIDDIAFSAQLSFLVDGMTFLVGIDDRNGSVLVDGLHAG